MSVKLAIASFLIAIVAVSCKPTDKFPDEPIIELQEFRVVADSASMIINFTDGDGNFGLDSDDNQAPNFCSGCPYQYNVFVDYHEKIDGEFVIIEPASPFHARASWATPTGQNPTQKGSITLHLPDYYLNSNNPSEILYKVRIVDRDLNESNEIVVGPVSITD